MYSNDPSIALKSSGNTSWAARLNTWVRQYLIGKQFHRPYLQKLSLVATYGGDRLDGHVPDLVLGPLDLLLTTGDGVKLLANARDAVVTARGEALDGPTVLPDPVTER